MKVRIILGLLAAALAGPLAAQAGEAITVHQDPGCGCCHGWAQHMRSEGFDVTEVPAPVIAAVKSRLGVPEDLASCHTAVLASSGQVIEGHVPASVVRKLLASTETRGVAAPGMPANAPGMGPMDGNLLTVDFEGRPFSRD